MSNSDSIVWEDCLDEMRVKPPLGAPIMLIDRRYSFVEITSRLYKDGIFSNEEGLKLLSRRSEPNKMNLKQPGSQRQPPSLKIMRL